MKKSFVVCWALALAAAGCDGASGARTSDQVSQDNIAEVGELYRHYQFMKKKPPQKLADFNTVRQLAGNGFDAISSGKVVVLFGATLPDTGEEASDAGADEVLAYQKDVPENGGYVLMLNRSVKKMSADEFKAAPRPAGVVPVAKQKN